MTGTLRLNVLSACPKASFLSVVPGPPGVPWLQPVRAVSVINAKPARRLFLHDLLTLKSGIWPHPLLAKVAQIPWSVFLFLIIQPTLMANSTLSDCDSDASNASSTAASANCLTWCESERPRTMTRPSTISTRRSWTRPPVRRAIEHSRQPACSAKVKRSLG